MRLPFTVIDEAGTPLPGAKVPPALIWVLPTVPVPLSVPPLTVMLELASVPVTLSVPALTVHGITAVLFPASVQTPLSILLKVLKFTYCTLIKAALKVGLPVVPPSWKVAAVPPSTEPLMLVPFCKVRTLPAPVK